MRRSLLPALALPLLLFGALDGASAGDENAEKDGKAPGQVLFYRMLGAQSNAPLPTPRTRSVCAIDGEEKTSSTGMALSGYTEYPFRRGALSYSASSTPFAPKVNERRSALASFAGATSTARAHGSTTSRSSTSVRVHARRSSVRIGAPHSKILPASRSSTRDSRRTKRSKLASRSLPDS